MAYVDGFSEGEVLVIDGDNITYFVKPNQITKDE